VLEIVEAEKDERSPLSSVGDLHVIPIELLLWAGIYSVVVGCGHLKEMKSLRKE
jgi:hypothetical protein